MKKTFSTHLAITLALLFSAALFSCSGDRSADAESILATVPSDASAVAVINAGSILEKAGCKVDGDKISPSDEAADAAAGIKDKDLRLLVQSLLSGESGVAPSAAVVFRLGYYNYLTGTLSTPAKFKAMVEKDFATKFVSEEGVDMAANVAVIDDRFWVNLGQHAVDPKEIKHFTVLDRAQSILANKASERLCQVTKDVEGWGNIPGIVNTFEMGFQERATTQIALQTIFDDPQSISFSAEFKKNEFVAEASVLDSKGSPAKYQFAAGEINLETVNSLGGDAGLVAAIDIPARMIAELKKQTESRSPSMLGIILSSLGSLDGTAAFAVNKSTRGIITTDGKDTSALQQLLSQGGYGTTKDGKFIRVDAKFTYGAAATSIPVSELAAPLKGAVAGFSMANAPGWPLKGAGITSLQLRKQRNSLSLNISVKSSDPGENILFSLL